MDGEISEDEAEIVNVAANAVGALMDLELEKAGDNEEKKKQIAKKYADIQFVANAAGGSATSYDLYMYFGTYTGNGSFYEILSTEGTWSHAGTTASDPGNASSTIMIPTQEFNVGAGSLVVDSDGDVGVGTTSPSEKLHVQGNAKATGYITAGTATTTSTTRYGSQTIHYDTQQHYDDNEYRYYQIGTIALPTGATSLSIHKIFWECDAAHEDGNEDHGVWVGVGGTTSGSVSSWQGYGTSINNGYHYIDWHYLNDNMSQTVSSTTNKVWIRLEDDDCITCGGDEIILYNMSVTVYYSYSVALQSGDIAASGRIYANNTTAIGDLAEHFEYDGPIEIGYIISYLPGTDNEYEMCTEPYSNFITGVISENPSVVLNSPDQGPPLALAGRVTVKLVDSDELIQGGDFITSSSTAGYGMKATKPGPVIGYAVKNQKAGEDFVEVLLQPGKYYIPPQYLDDDYDDIQEEVNGKKIGKR